MQPNSPQQPQPTASIDYLNAISTPSAQKTLNPFVLWGVIAMILGALAFTVVALMSGGNKPTENFATFAAELSSLEAVSEDSRDNIQTGELRTINSSVLLALADAKQGAEKLNTVPLSKKNDSLLAIQARYTKLSETLDDARLNVVFDRTYARELRFALSSLRAQMNALYEDSSSESLKTYLEETDANFEPLLAQLGSFTAD